MAVHPRGRGEQGQSVGPVARFIGSSPRARGTGHPGAQCWQLQRFIPAGAGNRCRCGTTRCRCSVHPRGRGEQATSCWVAMSSLRFIPAGAGNRLEEPPPPPPFSVHPRGRGEQKGGSIGLIGLNGSSPRTRGTVWSAAPSSYPWRFIPADAGNRIGGSGSTAPPSVHPRGRGEQQHNLLELLIGNGSSPRTRGTDLKIATHIDDRRFIPAGAGNRKTMSWAIGRPPVHPRGRGEQLDGVGKRFGLGGSSPRARGTANL